MNFGSSIILKKNRLKSSLNFLSQLSLQINIVNILSNHKLITFFRRIWIFLHFGKMGFSERTLNSILKYMNSHLFNPSAKMDLSLLHVLTRNKGERLKIETKDAPDELKEVVIQKSEDKKS